MNRNAIAALAALLVAAVALPGVSLAAFPTVEEALTDMFGEGAEITHETRDLDAATLLKLEHTYDRALLTEEEKEAWGCPTAEDYDEAMAELAEAEDEPTTSLEFYNAVKDGKKLGSAMIVDAPGKWGMIDYIVGLNPEGAVTRVEVLAHSERRGSGITRRTFLSQFEGKTAGDEIQVMKDITAVSGATVSSRSACEAVTKAVVFYKELYLTDAKKAAPKAEGKAESKTECKTESKTKADETTEETQGEQTEPSGE